MNELMAVVFGASLGTSRKAEAKVSKPQAWAVRLSGHEDGESYDELVATGLTLAEAESYAAGVRSRMVGWTVRVERE